MKKQPKKETHYGQKVWVNPTTESIRKGECLCLNCGNLKPGRPNDYNCRIAQSLYDTCVLENIAMAITRCPHWKPKVS